MDFSFLDKKQAQPWAWYPLFGVQGHDPKKPIRLKVYQGTSDNHNLINYLLTRAEKVRELANAGHDADFLDATREEDKKAYAAHVLHGWENMPNSEDKEETPFTPELGAQFINKLPGYMFDRLRNWCGTPENFVPKEEAGNTDAAIKN